MKIKTKNRKKIFSVLLLTGLMAYASLASGQTICSNNTDTAYGLTTSGAIYAINLNNAGVRTTPVESITRGTDTAANANAVGYNSLNGKFYYFYRTKALNSPTSEFVSYDPATNTLSVLAGTPPGGSAKIRSGCVNNSGTGYYCFDIVGTTPSLWYYDITTSSSTSWTKITSSFINGASDYTTNFQSLNSGDMAFDIQGNLWMIISKSTQYALYKISNPVPTALQASITVQEIIPPTAMPNGGGVSFTGLAFNANGTAFLTTGSGTGVNNNKLYKMTTVASGLSYVATLSIAGTGDDLTSCVFTDVLPVKWLSFSAELMKQKGVQLKWNVIEDNNAKQYYVERSSDGTHWERLSPIKREAFPNQSGTQYNYIDYEYSLGKNFYRIVQEDVTGKTQASEIKQVIAKDQSLIISPNPAKDKLNIVQKSIRANHADIYDGHGRLILSIRINYSTESVDISKLVKGNYFLKLNVDGIETASVSFIKL